MMQSSMASYLAKLNSDLYITASWLADVGLHVCLKVYLVVKLTLT